MNVVTIDLDKLTDGYVDNPRLENEDDLFYDNGCTWGNDLDDKRYHKRFNRNLTLWPDRFPNLSKGDIVDEESRFRCIVYEILRSAIVVNEQMPTKERINASPELCTCCTCGYQWVKGLNGSHSCSEKLKGRVIELEEVIKRVSDCIKN